MIALIILGAIVGLLLILLFLPLTIDLSYGSEFLIKIKYSGITIFDNKKGHKKEKAKTQKKKITSKQAESSEKDNFFKKTYKQRGLMGTIHYFSVILKIVIKKIFWVAKRFKFRRFKFDLTVATQDAADTAVKYGEVCAVTYPVFSLLQSVTNFKPQEVNISADFDKTKWEFKCAILVRTSVIYWIIAGISVLIEIFKIQRKESEKNERKQSKDRNGHNTAKSPHNG